jgi:hypothetical protein
VFGASASFLVGLLIDINTSNWRDVNIYMGVPIGLLIAGFLKFKKKGLLFFTVNEPEKGKNVDDKNEIKFKPSIQQSLFYIFRNVSLIILFFGVGTQTLYFFIFKKSIGTGASSL